MRTLLVSDLHYDLRKLDWVLAEAAEVDLVAIAGDLLDVGSAVPLDAQIAVVLEYLARMETGLAHAATQRAGRWLWVYHGPPEGPLSWTGSRHFGDPELPRLLDQHHPDIVLCGHIHQAPYVDGGTWFEQRAGTWLFNSGFQTGPVPAHVLLDLSVGSAEWWSFQGQGTTDVVLGGAQAS